MAREEHASECGLRLSLYLSKQSPEPVQSTVLQGGRERILVVEDDPMVRDFASGTLVSLGYSVTCVENAAEALRTLETDSQVDLVFSDVVMPGPLDGRAMASEIRVRYPKLPVVLATGYADIDGIGATSRMSPLAKPYSRRQLAEVLREAIDAPQDDG